MPINKSDRFAFPSDFASVFGHDDGLQARPVMAKPEPFNIRADRIAARFNSPVIGVSGFALLDEIPADIPLQVLVKKHFGIFTQLTRIPLKANHINRPLIEDLTANFALASHRVNGHDRAFERP